MKPNSVVKFSSYFWAIVLVVILYYFKNKIQNFNLIFDQLISNALSVNGVLIGFFLTILLVLQTNTAKEIELSKKSEKFPELLNILSLTIFWHFRVISICMFMPILKQIPIFENYDFEFKILVISIIFLSWSFSIIFTRTFLRIFGNLKPSRGSAIFGD
jgi:hypothetical protein